MPHTSIQNDKEQLETLIATLDDIVFELSVDKVFLNVWTREDSHLFLPREQFLNKNISEVLGPLAPKMGALIDEAIDSRERKELIYKHIAPDVQKYFRAQVSIIDPGEGPSKYRVIVSVRDVTETVLQQKKLEATQKKLSSMMSILDRSQQLSKSGGWEYRLDTNEVFWTDQSYTIFDIPKDTQLTYEMATQLFIDVDSKALDEMVKKAVEAAVPYQRVLRARNGKWIQIIGEPIIEDGEIISLIGAIMDITDKKNAELELIRAKEAAEEAGMSKTNFLSVMSHEIRTPLNGIIGIANLLELNKTPEQEELIDSLVFSANHLLKLVNDILDLNKIQGEKLTLINDDISLRELAENISRQFQSVAKDKQITLRTEIDERIPPYVITDAVRMGQILNNLVNNAVKFTDTGSVTISLSLVDQTAQKATIRFSVADTGPGIPEDYQQKIFEPFEQITQGSNRKHAGTGLGLQIAQKLVAVMGGTLKLHSQVGHGSDFYFEIQLDIPENNNKGKEQPLDNVSHYLDEFSQIKLLLAEDNPVNTLVARKQLESFGITPACADNGKKALDLLQQDSFDIALLDLHMPEMDGFELSAHIRKNYPDVHIVIFTADITKDAQERLANLNVHDIINKPFVPREMFNILLKVWDEKLGIE